MANGKWQMWEDDAAQLERITNWAANGLTDEQIAKSMGIRRETLWVWKRDHPNISNALKKGRMLACEVIENALFKKAAGMVVEDTVEEYRGELRDGKPSNGTVVKRTTRRQIPPDTAAVIFYLKNRMPDRYTDKRTTEVAVTAPTISLGIEPGRADD